MSLRRRRKDKKQKRSFGDRVSDAIDFITDVFFWWD